MKLRWSPEASADLESIALHIEADKPDAASKVVSAIYRSVTDLVDFPLRGRKGRVQGTRELVFPSLPYIAIYRVRVDLIEIVRIFHGAQDWP
jgi:toxin ParE1/3/4